MEELTNEKALLAGSSRVRAAIRRYLVPRSVPSLRARTDAALFLFVMCQFIGNRSIRGAPLSS